MIERCVGAVPGGSGGSVNNETFAVLLASVVDASPACAPTLIGGDTGTQTVDVPSSLAPVHTLIVGHTATRFGTPSFSPRTLGVVQDIAVDFGGFVTVGNSGIGTCDHVDVS
jgi:hypothetical protein